jgi:hypothetical protein
MPAVIFAPPERRRMSFQTLTLKSIRARPGVLKRLGPLDELKIDLLEAFEQFKSYVYDTTKVRTNDRRTDFKAAVKAMFGDKIELTTATTRPNPGRAIIKGLGYAVNNFSDADNVVDINAVKNFRAGKPDVEEITSTVED